MTDTKETLQSALDDLTRRVAAFEKAQEAEVEPPMLTEDELRQVRRQALGIDHKLHKRYHYVEAELARLREGLEVRPGDMSDDMLPSWVDAGIVSREDVGNVRRLAREIQRHRALLDGAK